MGLLFGPQSSFITYVITHLCTPITTENFDSIGTSSHHVVALFLHSSTQLNHSKAVTQLQCSCKKGGGGVHNFITSSLVLSLVNKAHLTKVITKGTPNALSRTCDMFQKSSHAKSFSFHKNHSTLKHYVLRALQFDGFTEV